MDFNTLRHLYRPWRRAGGKAVAFDYTACFGPLLRRATAGFDDRRLALAIDPANRGDRFTIRTVSVVLGRCALGQA